jgi:predicted outer membrane protein
MVPGAWGLPPDLTGLDDGQLAGIVQAIHQADIEHLQLALTRSSTAELLSFARDGIQMHRTAAGQDDADLAQMRITPAVSSTSQQVLADWQRDQAELQVVQPGEFDRAFINHHVTRDTRALALLDAAIDRVRSQTLKGHLLTDRVAIAGHLREAQRVQMLLRPPRP